MQQPSFPRPVLLSIRFVTVTGLAVAGLVAGNGLAAEHEKAASAPAVVKGADPTRPVETTWPPKGEPMRINVTRDMWVSTMGSEKSGNNGGASQLKFKGEQELTILDVNASSLKGKIVTGALMHMKLASADAPLLRVTASTVSAPWVEGTGTSYAEQEGASCWSFLKYNIDSSKAVPWTFPGSNVLDASFGLGHTIWKFADATRPDGEGWQVFAVDPDVVAANAAGLSYGIGLWDDVGNEWSFKNDTFKFIQHPNRFVYSKDQNAGSAPWLEVWTSGTDKQAPEAIREASFKVETKNMPAGEALLTWQSPADKGGAKTLGYNVTLKNGKQSMPLPRYLIPMAGQESQTVRMHIQDLDLKSGAEIEVSISPVDTAGNVGAPLVKTIKVSDTPAVFDIEKTKLTPFALSADLPTVAGLKVAVVDLTDKIEGKSGTMVPSHPDGYKGGNHLWSAEKKVIRLQAGKNECVAFQVNLEGKAKGITVNFKMATAGVATKVYRLDYVKTGNGMMPDAAVPLVGAMSIPFEADPETSGNTNASLLCEAYIPHETKAGEVKGFLQVSVAGESLQIPVELTVWDFTLPNKLSFVPEMNAYSTVGADAQGLAYYRLAHEHRTCINRLPYGWDGDAKIAPKWTGKAFEWNEWDKEYAPILSGTAFGSMPRKGEPVDVFYLPFSESWPMSIWDAYTKSYWPETAFTEEYRSSMQKAYALFVEHLKARGWTKPQYQFFLNNKVYYKESGTGWRNSAAPWIFDEPVNTQDFWALRWYGILWHQAVDPVAGDVKAWYRCDISRSDFGRNILWDVMDIVYFGGGSDHKARQKHDEQVLASHTYFAEYGGANDPGDANLAGVTWCLLAWSRGAIGVLPWQTIGGASHWSQGESTCVFYPPMDKGGPVASIRLKTFRQGQQDVEYLTLLGDAYNQPQFAVAGGMKKLVDLQGKVIKRSEEDAGIIKFDKVDATSLWQMRCSVGEMLSAKKPEYKRALVDHRSPEFDMNKLPDIGYGKVAPTVETHKPD